MKPPSLAIDPFDDAFLGDPYAYHPALRDAGPVVWLEPLGTYAMARYGEVHAALRDHETFCSGRGVGLSDFATEEPWRPPSLLLEADPPLHARTRGLMNKIVSLASLKALRPVWQERAAQLADELVERRCFDAVIELSEVYPLRIFPDAVGLREDGREHLLPYALANFNAFGPRNKLFEDSQAAAQEAIAWVAESCQRNNLRSGGWGAAIHAAADDGDCTREEAERLVRSLLSAGVDTTVNGIGHLILAFAQHPDQYARVRERPELVRKAPDESLRWDSTVQTFFRTTTRAVTVDGHEIPEGAKVLLFLAAANRDPRKWNDPDRFDLDRPTSGHVGFGFGIHQCLGQMVARLEGELILAALTQRVREIHLAGPVLRRLNNTLHAIASLPVELVPI